MTERNAGILRRVPPVGLIVDLVEFLVVLVLLATSSGKLSPSSVLGPGLMAGVRLGSG